MDQWATKEEIAKELNISLEEVEKALNQQEGLPDKFIEKKDGKYKINNKDGKAVKRVSTFLDELDGKYEVEVDGKAVENAKKSNHLEKDGKTLNSAGNKKVEGNIDKLYADQLRAAHKRTSYLHLKYMLEKKTDYPEEVKKYLKKEGHDFENQADLLEDANLFEIDDKTKWILQMTNNEIFERKMPYPKVCIDCDLKIDDLWFRGFLINTEGYTWTYWGKKDLICTNFLIFNTFSNEKEKIEEYFKKDIKKSTIKKLKMFICSFFDFLNNPEVRIIQVERGEKNRQRRIKAGKEPLPPSSKIKITGTLKTYLEKVEFSGSNFNYRFWVRGHFMRFWDKKRFAKLYYKLKMNDLPKEYYVDDRIRHHTQILMKWKKPFIKGSGVLVTKRYEVKK